MLPFGGGYTIFAGLGTLVDFLGDFRLGRDEIDYLHGVGYDSEFLNYLEQLSFRGTILAPPEGEIMFPVEPVVRVEGNLLEVQIIETLLLNTLNFPDRD